MQQCKYLKKTETNKYYRRPTKNLNYRDKQNNNCHEVSAYKY